MEREGPGKHLKVHIRVVLKGSWKGMCFLRVQRGRKIAIECYTNCIRNGALYIAYPLLDHADVIFFVAFFSCLNTQCKQGQQNKVLKNFCVSGVCVCGGGGGGGGWARPPWFLPWISH